jgi:hypothetical protein
MPQTETGVGHVRTLKVYIEGSQERWEAICLDFDIAVQGTTIDATIASMKEAISLYLERVRELPEKEQTAFLRRRAPLHVRFRFVTHALLSSWKRARSVANGKTRGEFLIPCPA